jgi:hypothetical protein
MICSSGGYLRNRIMNLQVTQAMGTLLISWVTISFSRRVCSHVLNYLLWPPSLHLTLNHLKTFCITILSMDFPTGMKRAWNWSLIIIQHSFPLYDRGFCTSFILCKSLLGMALHLKDEHVPHFRCPTASSLGQTNSRSSKMNYLSDTVQHSTNSTINFFFIFNQCYQTSQSTLKGLKSYTLKRRNPS